MTERSLPAHEVADLLAGTESGFLAAWSSPAGLRVLYPDGRVFRRKAGSWDLEANVTAVSVVEWWRRHRDHNAAVIVVLTEAPIEGYPTADEVLREAYRL